MFQYQSSLRELYLYDNQIEKLESRTFSNLRNLKILDLNKNRLKTISSSTFNHLQNLNGLGLEANKFVFVRQIAENLKNLANLTRVCLGKNPISKFTKELSKICNERANCWVKTESTCLRTIFEDDFTYIHSNIFSGLRMSSYPMDIDTQKIIG